MLQLGKELAGEFLPNLEDLYGKYPDLKTQSIDALYLAAIEKMNSKTSPANETTPQKKV
jgi:hypothetical protein